MKLFYNMLLSYLTPLGIKARDFSEDKQGGIKVTFYNETRLVTMQYSFENAGLDVRAIKELAKNVARLLTKRALDGGGCACENVDEANRGTWLVCGQCLKPRRQ